MRVLAFFLFLFSFAAFQPASSRFVPTKNDTCSDRSGEKVCAWYHDQGYCSNESIHAVMEETCSKTCGFCKP
ncbi:hypothetical protein L596_012817 [Steinernema carpocapsae]|uniref:ShKT domain-containing protein n=1 Tax=Steinernema carpocapsae TaxID=34508 RepID=A0A4U5NYJ7_STECR|nr:hypothetical protein L596_012817 [Steinernema carpocapsae]